MRLRLLTPAIITFFATMAASQYPVCAFAEDDVIHFTGRIVLPHDLYTLTGTRLERGTCKLQIRSEDGGYWLSFWHNGQQTVELKGQVREDNTDAPVGIPMFGTLRMVPDKSLGRAAVESEQAIVGSVGAAPGRRRCGHINWPVQIAEKCCSFFRPMLHQNSGAVSSFPFLHLLNLCSVKRGAHKSVLLR